MKERKTPLGIEKRFDRFSDWIETSWTFRMSKPMLDRYPKVIPVLTWLMRIAAGGAFVVSGLSKGIDPWGTFYKLSEYLTAMHLPLEDWGNAVIVFAFLLFALEFIVGASILLGLFRKAAPIVAALFMIFMLPFTLWIAIADPVADCGCFGDFIKLSNWATFAKNVVLSIAVVWLLKFNRSAFCLISPYLQWMATVALTAYIGLVGYIGYWQQPLVDFRPYPLGSQLLMADDGPEFTPVFDFIYEKDGEQRVFSAEDELPDESEGWKFLRRVEREMKKNASHKPAPGGSGDFRVWNETGDEDLTEFVASEGPQAVLLVPDLSRLSMSASWKINRLYDIAVANDMEFFAIAAGSPDAIEQWRDLSSGQYPVYTSEDTSIKEVARGNPALVLLDGGKIVGKTALSALRLNDEAGDDVKIMESLAKTDGKAVLLDLTELLLSILAVLSLFSALVAPFLSRGVNAKEDKKKNRKAP